MKPTAVRISGYDVQTEMESAQTPDSIQTSTEPAPTMAIVAGVTAALALIGAIATYLLYLRAMAASPKNLLIRCRQAIDQIEHNVGFAEHA